MNLEDIISGWNGCVGGSCEVGNLKTAKVTFINSAPDHGSYLVFVPHLVVEPMGIFLENDPVEVVNEVTLDIPIGTVFVDDHLDNLYSTTEDKSIPPVITGLLMKSIMPDNERVRYTVFGDASFSATPNEYH